MHNIHYRVEAENVNRSKVMASIQEHARRDGDGYSSKMTWHDNIPPLSSEDAATEFIRTKDNGWYDDHAVRFYDYSKVEKSAKIKQYENKIEELKRARAEYEKAHSVHSFKAQYIGCPKCGSKLNKDCFTGERCPLCHTELRSETTTSKLNWYKEQILKLKVKIEEEQVKSKKKAKVMWLIKYEYHS